MLALFVATTVALVIDINMIGRPILKSVVTLGAIIPSLSVAARRLHDTDRSGWWQLIGVVPLIGAIVLIVWFASAAPRATIGSASRRRASALS